MNLDLFAFTLDGKVDYQSINPLEMTKYERFGYVLAVIVVGIAMFLDYLKYKKLKPADAKDDVLYTPVQGPACADGGAIKANPAPDDAAA